MKTRNKFHLTKLFQRQEPSLKHLIEARSEKTKVRVQALNLVSVIRTRNLKIKSLMKMTMLCQNLKELLGEKPES